MGNTKPRTIDEFFIEKYQKLEEENNDLKQQLEMYKDLEKAQDENIEFWKNKYYELVNNLKNDFGFILDPYAESECTTQCISVRTSHIWNDFGQEEKYAYYKKLFNLKEEGENEDEQ